MMDEIWKDIQGYEGIYQVSNFGNVKRISHIDTKYVKGMRIYKERPLHTFVGSHGYVKVKLNTDNQRSEKAVHRLVALAFIPNERNCDQINHIDGNKLNNNVNNLEWCTCMENIHHAMEHGLFHASKKGA